MRHLHHALPWYWHIGEIKLNPVAPHRELFFNQISDGIVAEPQKLPKRSLAGDCASSAIGGPSGLAGPITRRKGLPRP